MDNLNGPEFWQTVNDSRGVGSPPGAGKWEMYECTRSAKGGDSNESKPPKPVKAPKPAATTDKQKATIERNIRERAKRDPEFRKRLEERKKNK